MKRVRDLTQKQFDEACKRLGFVRCLGPLGYYQLAANPNVHVSIWNAGERRRDHLAYLIRIDNRYERERAIENTEQT